MTALTKPKVKGKHHRVFTVWKSESGALANDWYWHCNARNGELICTGGEGYKRRGHAIKMAASFMRPELGDVLLIDGVQIPVPIQQPKPIAWMSQESLRAIKLGLGSGKGTVPVHLAPSRVSTIALCLAAVAP